MASIRPSLRTRFVFAFATVLVPVLVLLAYEFWEDYQRRVSIILGDQLQTAQAVAGLVDARIDEGLMIAGSLSADSVVLTMDPDRLDPYLRRQQQMFPQLAGIAVYDGAGRNVGSSIPFGPDEVRPNVADRRYFQRLLATGQEQVSEVLVGRISRRAVVLLACPLRGSDNAVRGAVVSSMDLDRLPQQLGYVRLSPGRAILLMDRTGRLAFSTSQADLTWEERDVSAEPAIQRALIGEYVLDPDYRGPTTGDHQLAAFVVTPEHRWVVGVTQPIGAALAPVYAEARRDVAGAVAVVVLAFVLSLLVSERVLAPVRRLTAHARSLGQTLGQLEADPILDAAIVQTGDELEELANSLDGMAREVQRRVIEVGRANARLAALTDVSKALIGQLTVRNVAELAVERGAAILDSELSGLWLPDQDRRELRLLAWRNLSEEGVAALSRLPLGDSPPSGLTTGQGGLLVVGDLATGHQRGPAWDAARREGVRSLVVAPLRTRAGLAGFLGYGRRRPGGFAEPETRTAEALADVFAVALERAQLVEDLHTALRVREEFLNLAAHELKTPLTTFRGYAQLLTRRGSHDDEEARLFRTMNVQADRMSHLVETLVDVSQIQSGELYLRPSPMALCKLVADVARAIQEAEPRHRITVRYTGPIMVEADRAQIKRVVYCLLDNAVKYSPNGGPVDVAVEARAGEAVVAVRDRGVGIPREKQARLFEAFYQVAPMVSPTTGMGLGLYISDEIVRRHGGRIWLESEEGQGSTFSFSLPVGEGRNEQHREAPVPPPAGEGR